MPQSPAEVAIGEDDAASDWQLRPLDHARTLPETAGALRRVLERDDIKRIMSRFDAADGAAIAAQAHYKRIGRLGLYAATVATVTGALFLLPIEPWLHGLPAAIASIVQVLGLVVAFLSSRYLIVAKPFDAWMKNRAAAEIARVELFDTVSKASETSRTGEIPLLPLALEYFRRYQLDVQRRYYSGRAAQHRASAWRNNRWLTAGISLTVISVLLGTVLALRVVSDAGVPMPDWLLILPPDIAGPGTNRISLALGVVASAFYGLGVARSLMDLDERNASRFATTSENLELLGGADLQAARAAAVAGASEAVHDFISEVQDQISSEHREWILLSAQREVRTDRLRYGQTS